MEPSCIHVKLEYVARVATPPFLPQILPVHQ
jgi:hypothetical protein